MLTDDIRAAVPSRVPLLDLSAMTRDIAPALDLVWADLMQSSAFIGGGWVERFEEEWGAGYGLPPDDAVALGLSAPVALGN